MQVKIGRPTQKNLAQNLPNTLEECHEHIAVLEETLLDNHKSMTRVQEQRDHLQNVVREKDAAILAYKESIRLILNELSEEDY